MRLSRERLPLDTFAGSSLHCSPWESRPDVHESMHHAAGVCVGPTPTAVQIGRSSAARFLVSGITAATTHRFARTDDPMTALTQLHSERPRHAGDHRLAGRSCALVGALGTGARWLAGADRSMRWSRMSEQDGRKQPWADVAFSRTSEFGYRSLEAGQGGAGSGFRGDAP